MIHESFNEYIIKEGHGVFYQRHYKNISTLFFKWQRGGWFIDRILSKANGIRNKCSFLSFCKNMKDESLRNRKLRSCNFFGGTFLMLKVSFQYFLEEFYDVCFQCQVDSIVVSIDYVPVLVSVILDLQRQFFVDVVIVNVQFQL